MEPQVSVALLFPCCAGALTSSEEFPFPLVASTETKDNPCLRIIIKSKRIRWRGCLNQAFSTGGGAGFKTTAGAGGDAFCKDTLSFPKQKYSTTNISIKIWKNQSKNILSFQAVNNYKLQHM